MSKSSRDLVENKLKNPVYSEILYKINKREVYLLDFANNDFKQGKAPSILARQLYELNKEDYLSKRLQGRKVLYLINWLKINEEFVNFLYEKALERDKYFQHYVKHSYMAKTLLGQIEVKRYQEGKQPHQLLLKEVKRKDLINNPFLVSFFQEVFTDLNRQKIYQPISSLFDYVMNKNIVDIPSINTGLVNSQILLKAFSKIQERADLSKQEKNKFNAIFDDLIKHKDDRDLVLYTIFDTFLVLKKTLDSLTYKEISSDPDNHFLYDFLITLPMLCNDVSKNQYFETAFISATANSKSARDYSKNLIKKMVEQGKIPKKLAETLNNYGDEQQPKQIKKGKNKPEIHIKKDNK